MVLKPLRGFGRPVALSRELGRGLCQHVAREHILAAKRPATVGGSHTGMSDSIHFEVEVSTKPLQIQSARYQPSTGAVSSLRGVGDGVTICDAVKRVSREFKRFWRLVTIADTNFWPLAVYFGFFTCTFTIRSSSVRTRRCLF